jgi:hypothetical protein
MLWTPHLFWKWGTHRHLLVEICQDRVGFNTPGLIFLLWVGGGFEYYNTCACGFSGERGKSIEPGGDSSDLPVTTSIEIVDASVVRSFTSEPVGGSDILPGFREPELGESSLGVVLDTLVPTYRETLSPTPIPTYQGRSIFRRDGSVGETGLCDRSGEGSGKEFTGRGVWAWRSLLLKPGVPAKKKIFGFY